jgi:hypothetical protein
MSILVTWSLYWLAISLFVGLAFIALKKGWIVNVLFACCQITGVVKDLACQAWLDIRKLWGKKITLDEHEEQIS